MRFLFALTQDIRYQAKYGFYFLYVFFSAVYIAALYLCPPDYKKIVAAIVILSDPAMLGSFFIGAIWLLEKSEGLHGFWDISPLRAMEYILSKAVSLALISTIVADAIAMAGLGYDIDYVMLSLSTFVGSMVFTTIGLLLATYARSVNQYMLLVSPLEIVITVPPILAAFGIAHPAFSVSPGMALWGLIRRSLDTTTELGIGMFVMLLLWLCAVLLLANGRVSIAMRQAEGGEKA